jgi:hypothetical protein
MTELAGFDDTSDIILSSGSVRLVMNMKEKFKRLWFFQNNLLQ